MAKRKPKLTMRALRRRHREELALARHTLDRALLRIGQLEASVRKYKQWLARDADLRRSPRGANAQTQREVEMNWEAYDQIAASITANERALFEASPAYQKYQQWRKTGKMVKAGDWRAP